MKKIRPSKNYIFKKTTLFYQLKSDFYGFPTPLNVFPGHLLAKKNELQFFGQPDGTRGYRHDGSGTVTVRDPGPTISR